MAHVFGLTVTKEHDRHRFGEICGLCALCLFRNGVMDLINGCFPGQTCRVQYHRYRAVAQNSSPCIFSQVLESFAQGL